MTLVVTAGPASAARTLNVASHGIDTATCGTAAQPCRSLAHAIARASTGDRILIGPGTYEGFLLEKRLTFESTHGAGATVIQPTVIDGNNFGIDVAPGADGAVIGKPSKGFTIRGEDFGVHVSAPDVVVEDNIVTAGRTGVSTTFDARRLALTGNLIVVGRGSSGSVFAGVVARGEGTEIVQNVIQGERTSPGILLFAEGSLVTDNVITGAFEGILVSTATTTIRRNTLVANAAGLWFEAPAGNPGVVVTSNNFLGNDAAGGNCGVLNAGTTIVVAGNYWGSATGAGDNPADDVCGAGATVTTPFLKVPVSVSAPAGR
jgi:nitrous oxidase accessory protein NosD